MSRAHNTQAHRTPGVSCLAIVLASCFAVLPYTCWGKDSTQPTYHARIILANAFQHSSWVSEILHVFVCRLQWPQV